MGKIIKEYAFIKNGGKIPGLAIVKTLDCGKKFKEERYIYLLIWK